MVSTMLYTMAAFTESSKNASLPLEKLSTLKALADAFQMYFKYDSLARMRSYLFLCNYYIRYYISIELF